jgi:hypothetical protein
VIVTILSDFSDLSAEMRENDNRIFVSSYRRGIRKCSIINALVQLTDIAFETRGAQVQISVELFCFFDPRRRRRRLLF